MKRDRQLAVLVRNFGTSRLYCVYVCGHILDYSAGHFVLLLLLLYFEKEELRDVTLHVSVGYSSKL